MLIIPAIDIKNGKCVRLLRGEEGTEIVFSEDLIETAKKWESCGASWIHVVDLDGAFTGEPKNLDLVTEIINSVSCSVQVGGGIRNVETVRTYINKGVGRVIIGTAAFSDQDFLKRACDEFPSKVAVGIDTKNGKIAVKGWRETLDVDKSEVLKDLKNAGVSVILHTNVDRDGTMEGVNLESVKNFIRLSPIPVIASGGIATMDDLDKLSTIETLSLYGVILGKSIYTGSIDLKKAVKWYG